MNTININEYNNLIEAANSLKTYLGKLNEHISSVNLLIQNLSEDFVGPAYDSLLEAWNEKITEYETQKEECLSYVTFLTNAANSYQQTDVSVSATI